MAIDLIFCAGRAADYSRIAHQHGFMLGTRTDYQFDESLPIHFADNHYHNVDWDAHLNEIIGYTERLGHKLKYATVPDLSNKEVFEADIIRALEQTEKLKPYCEVVYIVPKLTGQIPMIPPEYPLACSVPTKYGGHLYFLWELAGRKIHLLGGDPHKQMKYYQSLGGMCQLLSVDGSAAKNCAVSYVKYWQAGGREGGQWQPLPMDDRPIHERRLEAWEISCKNIYAAWQTLQER